MPSCVYHRNCFQLIPDKLMFLHVDKMENICQQVYIWIPYNKIHNFMYTFEINKKMLCSCD